MEVRKLTEADAETFWNIRLRALRDNPESFGASFEEFLDRGIAGVVQGLRKSATEPDDATFGAFERNIIGIAGFRREPDVPYQGELAVMMSLSREKFFSTGDREKEGRHA